MSALLPPLARAALLLDLDGTLIDIADRPEHVMVPETLPPLLTRLRARLGDALAIVTGRKLADIDRLLPGVPFAVAAEHGGVLRPSPGAGLIHVPNPPVPEQWRAEAETLAARHPGAWVEPKTHGFALHYRAAPEAGEMLRAALSSIVDDARYAVLPAKMAWEVKPAGIDKGRAVGTLMRAPPFTGRLPVFIGDDVTDTFGIVAADRLGGAGLFVPEVFGSPARVRAWLAGADAAGEWPAP